MKEVVEGKCIRFDVVSADKSVTTSDKNKKNHACFLKDTKDVINMEKALVRMNEVVLLAFVQEITLKHSQHSIYCKNVYVKIINIVQRSKPFNIYFWNEKRGE